MFAWCFDVKTFEIYIVSTKRDVIQEFTEW